MYELKGFGFVMPHWAYWGWLAVMPLLLGLLLDADEGLAIQMEFGEIENGFLR